MFKKFVQDNFTGKLPSHNIQSRNNSVCFSEPKVINIFIETANSMGVAVMGKKGPGVYKEIAEFSSWLNFIWNCECGQSVL